MPKHKPRNVRDVATPQWRAHWQAAAQLGGLYTALERIYTDYNCWPPIGREGAFPFAFIEQAPPHLAALWTDLWNQLIALQIRSDNAEPVAVEMLALERRLLKGIEIMRENIPHADN